VTTVTYRVSEEDFVTANRLAFRDQAWTRWVVWGAAAVVGASMLYALVQLVFGREDLLWVDPKYLFAVGSVGAFAAYKRRWGYAKVARNWYRRAPKAGDEITAVWSDDRITLSDAATSQIHAWTDVKGWADTGAVLAIWMRDGTVLSLPKAAMGESELADLKTHMSLVKVR
jgi:hypothetical protein